MCLVAHWLSEDLLMLLHPCNQSETLIHFPQSRVADVIVSRPRHCIYCSLALDMLEAAMVSGPRLTRDALLLLLQIPVLPNTPFP